MNEYELRAKALELAIGTPGQPNKLDTAREYLTFLMGDKKTDALQTKVKK